MSSKIIPPISMEEEKAQKTAYRVKDRESLKKSIFEKRLCSYVQKWIIQDKDLEALGWMTAAKFKLAGCLEGFYKDKATAQMKEIYKFELWNG